MPTMPRTTRLLPLALPATLVLAAAMVALPAGPAANAQNTPGAAPDTPGSSVTVHIDPSYQQPEFEGWGTSLVWFANITGGYPDEIRHKLVDMLFADDGLRLNIARYNVGGGNAPDVRDDYMKVGATMPAFWKAPPGTTHTDVDWWDPDNPDHWNLDADANQRWWIDQIKDRVDRWEAFSNSPPYFQTVSGYVSGGFDSSADQIRADRVDDFATYLTRVVDHIEQEHGISFDTVDPLNEPNTPYWGTQLGPDGQPTGGRQEGAHAGPALQQLVVKALRRALDTADTRAVVAAMDETNPGTFTTNWNAYDAEARAAVDQLNVHTYGTGQRTSVRDLAKGSEKKLWMSEVEGSWGSGTSYTSMESGLGIATRIVDDLRELEPSAWVFWQPIEDAIPQQAGGGNWGSIHIPFDCTADDTLETCPIQPNTKYDTIRNFTHHIRPGDHLVKVDDPSSVAAVKASGRAATVVHVNNSAETREVTLDLSRFKTVDAKASVTPVVSSADGGLVTQEPIQLKNRTASFVVPAKSVTTFVVEGVRGVAKEAAYLQPGHVYRLQGVQSGRSLAPSNDQSGVVIRTNDAENTGQLWTVRKLTGGTTHRERYAIDNAGNGKRLAAQDNAAGLVDVPPGEADVAESAQWILSTTGDGTWTFVNAATGRLIDVPGQATDDGSPVSTYTPTSGPNQRWAVVDETAQRTETVETYTVPGRTPTLPEVVTPVYPDGARGTLPVTWTMPPDGRWREPGTVHVTGTATDPLGRLLPAKAVVTVDTFTSTLAGRAKTYVGGQPDLPTTVVGVGEHGGRAQLPVTWGAPPDGAYDQAGVTTLPGVAEVVDGTTVEATVRVQVTEPVPTNLAPEEDVAVGATFTESGYSPERVRNGDRTDKAWSNWKPGTKNPSDTLTFSLPGARDLTRVVTYFYRDGDNISFPESLKVQVQTVGGDWADASDDIPVGTEGSPVIDVPLPADAGPAAGVRVVMTARPSGYMTVSEIEVYAKAPGVSSDASAASIEVDGVPLADFDPDTTEYDVTGDPSRSEVTATPADPYATVTIHPDERTDRSVLVTVTSEDRDQTRDYRLRFVPR
ncbi:glycoside hydrolase [Actinopolymorpha sp. B9G3]|uniref:glycoside hydrolase n=1 Tax=Actinopolymorpha sp. B9G3 TaxID=3158970 RepID=UPI0032D971C4